MFKSLNTKLFVGYLGSLVVLTVFFFLVIHIYMLPFGIDLFYVLIFVLAVIGFIIIYRLTSTIMLLSSQVKQISTNNLDRRITDIKRDDEIGELAGSFNNLLDRLDAAFKRERQFIADVAHELKTPMATMRSSIEVALSKERSKDEYKKVLINSISDLAGLSSTLNNVLDLAWSESPVEKRHRTRINLSELINELSEIAVKMAAGKNLKVESNITPGIHINGFKDRLAHSVINLIDNATKYTDKGKIDITLKKIKDTAFILIKDTGLGIPEKDREYIFDRFYRADEHKMLPGSGLGLAIAKSIIQLHDGTIEAESNHKKGTTFIIALPIVK